MRFKLLKKQTKNTNNQEKSCGRSMVEMLGVLAIIGVLSIGGIQGYTMSMRRYRANEILAIMQKYATILYSNCISAQLNGYLSEAESDAEEVKYDNGYVKTALVCPDPIAFLQGGIGGLPSGVLRVNFSANIVNDDKKPTISDWNIIRTNSGDMVRFYVVFNDQNLCRTTLNVVGTQPADSRAFGYCQEETWGQFYGLVSFIMN